MENILQPVITNNGLTAVFNADNDGLQAKITHIALGLGESVDGNDQGYVATETATSLKNQKELLDIQDGATLNSHQLHLTAVATSDEEYWVNEIGIFLDDGTLFAIYSDPSRPLAFKSKEVDLLLAFDLLLANLPGDSVTFESIEGGIDLPPATQQKRGIVQLATSAEVKEGVDDLKVMTPKASAERRYGLDSIDGAHKDVLQVNDQGYVGIGTSNPEKTLDVRGELQVKDNLHIDNGNVHLSTGTLLADNPDAKAIFAGEVQVKDILFGGRWYQGVGADIKTPRHFPGIAAIGDKIYLAGGEAGTQDYLEVYDTTVNQWQAKTPMNHPRHRPAAAMVGGDLYVIAGAFGGSGGYDIAVDYNEKYNLASDTWETKAPIPTPRFFMSVSVVNDVIYIIGGIDNVTHKSTNIVSAYSVATDTWEETTGVSDLLAMPDDFEHWQLHSAVVNDNIYVFGNYETYEYNLIANTWTKKADMPNIRTDVSVTEYGNKIYVMGGGNSSGGLTAIDVYDPETDSWSQDGDMPVIRSIISAVVGDKIYAFPKYKHLPSLAVDIFHPGYANLQTHVQSTLLKDAIHFDHFGHVGVGTKTPDETLHVGNGNLHVDGEIHVDSKLGIGTNNPKDSLHIDNGNIRLSTGTLLADNPDAKAIFAGEVQVKDILFGGRWYQGVGADIITPRHFPGIAVIGDKIYLAGGEAGTRDYLEVYDTTVNQWQAKTPMNHPRHRPAAAAVGGDLYVIAGAFGASGIYDNAVDYNEKYNLASDTWETKAPIPTPRFFMSVSVVNDVIYIIGGIDNVTHKSTNIVSAYSVATNTWEETTGVSDLLAMPDNFEHWQLHSAVVNDNIYVFGNYETYEYNLIANTWTKKADMPNIRTDVSVTEYGNKIYVMGGGNSSGGLTAIDVYDPETDSWSQDGDMPVIRSIISAVVGDKIYAFPKYKHLPSLAVDIFHPGYANLQTHVQSTLLKDTMSFNHFGRVGLNTTKPQAQFHINDSHQSGFVDFPFLEDGLSRPRFAMTGSYPEINLFSDSNNATYGPTLRFGSFDDSSHTNYKHWVMGTSGMDSKFLDFGFAENSENPHAGIRGYSEGQPARTIMTLKSDRKVGIGVREPQTELHVDGGIPGNVAAPLDYPFNNDSERTSLSVTGPYPEINLFSSHDGNTSFGSTLRFGGFDDATHNSWKHWVMGTSGADCTFLDIGFAANTDNPHIGTRDTGGGTTVMTFLNNGNVGVGTIMPTYKFEVDGGDIRVNNGHIHVNGNVKIDDTLEFNTRGDVAKLFLENYGQADDDNRFVFEVGDNQNDYFIFRNKTWDNISKDMLAIKSDQVVAEVDVHLSQKLSVENTLTVGPVGDAQQWADQGIGAKAAINATSSLLGSGESVALNPGPGGISAGMVVVHGVSKDTPADRMTVIYVMTSYSVGNSPSIELNEMMENYSDSPSHAAAQLTVTVSQGQLVVTNTGSMDPDSSFYVSIGYFGMQGEHGI